MADPGPKRNLQLPSWVKVKGTFGGEADLFLTVLNELINFAHFVVATRDSIPDHLAPRWTLGFCKRFLDTASFWERTREAFVLLSGEPSAGSWVHWPKDGSCSAPTARDVVAHLAVSWFEDSSKLAIANDGQRNEPKGPRRVEDLIQLVTSVDEGEWEDLESRARYEMGIRLIRVRPLPRSRAAVDRLASSQPAQLTEASVPEEEFQPPGWFKEHTHIGLDRLRQATRKGRKSKRVATREVDGVKLYSVKDARRWWPEDFKE